MVGWRIAALEVGGKGFRVGIAHQRLGASRIKRAGESWQQAGAGASRRQYAVGTKQERVVGNERLEFHANRHMGNDNSTMFDSLLPSPY